MIAASAPSRSRVNDSAISVRLSALSSKTIAAKTPAVTKPANATKAVKPRRIHHGTSTLPSSATPDAPSSASVGESASQSTFGVVITRSLDRSIAGTSAR